MRSRRHWDFILGPDGWRIIPFDSIGRAAAREVGELLRGATPASIRIPESLPSQLLLERRQVRPWNIDPDRIPADAVVRIRPFARAEHENAMGCQRGFMERTYLIAPAGAYVGQWLLSFKESPPRRSPGSFNLERVMERVMSNAGGR